MTFWLKVRNYLGVVLVPLVVTALLFAGPEVLLRAFWPQDVRIESAQSLGVRDDSLGHSLRSGNVIIERTPEFTATYITNSQGFRDRAVYCDTVPDGRTRILLVGDSFAFGQGVDYGDAWPMLLENGLRSSGRDVEIIKAGVPAYDTRTEVLQMRELVGRFHPDVVMMAFLPNDLFTNLPTEDSSEAMRRAVRETEETVAQVRAEKSVHLHLVTFAERVVMSADYLYCALYAITPRKGYFATPLSEHVQAQLRTTRALLEMAKAICERSGARFLVVSIPQQFQVLYVSDNLEMEGIDPGWIDQEFARHAEANGYTWLPTLAALVEAYKGNGRDLYYRLDGHLTAEGNNVLAGTLLQHEHLFDG